jgi:magnesium transporter
MFFRHSSKKPGLSPGTLTCVGDKKHEKVKINIIDYDARNFEEREVASLEDRLFYREKDTVIWINVSGIHELEIIKSLGEHFALHPLVLEDIISTDHRPKMEDFDEYLFLVLKMLHAPYEDEPIQYEHISIISTPRVVIPLQEYEGDIFDPIRERIRNAKGRIRKKGTDYLAYALLDIIVDYYFNIFEHIGERVEELQETVLTDPKPEALAVIQELRREMITLRKSVWPLREIINTLVRDDSPLISADITVYLRDVYDHAIQAIDAAEIIRDLISGIMDMYMSSVSNRMNEVMKVLTVIATIFIPMTFLAGIYGMNFKFMPELEWRCAYPLLWAVMITIFLSMIAWFKRKKWL